MKRNIFFLMAFCCTLVFIGCRKKPPAEPENYDPKTDAPFQVSHIRMNPLLVADQTVVARRVQSGELAGLSGDVPPSTEVEPSGQTTTEPAPGTGEDNPANTGGSST